MSGDASTRGLVALGLLYATAGGAVAALALVGRTWTDGVLDGLLLGLAVVGALYAGSCAAGVMMFAVVGRLADDAERTVRRLWLLAWTVAVVSVPVASYLLGFDRDQWLWGTGSTVLGLCLAILFLRNRKA